MGAFPSLLAVTLLKGTLLLGVALLLGIALHRAPGLARHRLWSVAFVALLSFPVFAVLLPPLPLPIPGVPPLAQAVPAWRSETTLDDTASPTAGSSQREATTAITDHNHGAAPGTDQPRAAGASPSASEAGAMRSHHEEPGRPSATPGGVTSAGTGTSPRIAPAGLLARARGGLLLVWLAGFAGGSGLLGLGIVRSLLQTRRARPLDDADWLRDLEWHRNFFGIRRRIRILTGAAVRTPMTGGVLRPVVLVPEDATEWSPVRRRLVLLHELVHIRRYDVVRHLLTRIGVALYWFHPLAWLAGRSSAIAREQACDEEVLRLGVKPSAYATHLLALAERLDTGRLPAATLPMIQRSQLETRLMKILDTNARPSAAWRSALAATLMVLTAVSVGVAAPASTTPPEEAATSPSEPTTAANGPVFGGLPSASYAVPATAAQESACWPEGMSRIRGSFSGSITTDDRSGRQIINGVGIYNGDRIVQHWVDDLRLCLRTHGDVDMEDDGRRIGSIGNGGLAVLEAELGGRLQSLVIRNDGSGEQATWTVNGETRPFDATAQRWRDQMTTVLGERAAITRLRGERSSLRGEISSIRGQRSSLRGQISSIRGQRSSLQGRISSIRGQRSSLRGEISSAHGRVSSLRGQISSARGHVSGLRGQISRHQSALHGLEASRFGASGEELEVIEAAERRHQEAIEEVERQIADYDVEARVAEIEEEIEGLDVEAQVAEIESRMADDIEAEIAEVEEQIAALAVEARVAEIEEQIAALDVEGRVADIEAEIEALNVDERVEEMQQRLEPALRELRATIESIG